MTSLSPTLLLTGATGYLGRRLLPRLLESGHRVFILKRPRSRLVDLPDNDRLRVFDIETDGLSAPFRQSEKIDSVIHLATCYGKSGESAAEIRKANWEMPANLLEIAITHGSENFINSDTYFNVLPKGGTCIDDYSLNKGLFQTWAFRQTEASGIRFINLRLEHLYGPNDSPQKFVNWLIQTLLASPPELEFTTGEQERDFIFIDDVIDAFSTVISHIRDLPCGPQEIGVGSGETTSIRHFVEQAKALCTAETRLIFGSRAHRKHEIMRSRADLTFLTRFGWQARVNLAKGLQQVVNGERRNLDLPENISCTS